MAERLDVREIEALGESAMLREAGLRAARLGELALARRQIDDARANIAALAFSDEAGTLFATYQEAAEAYLAYRSGAFDRARAQMTNALCSANRLSTLYGYRCELRRVHLAANLVKIAAEEGRHREAAASGQALLRYMAGERTAWPWPELSIDDPDDLCADAKDLLVRQLASWAIPVPE